ncbi:MAG TPA: 3-oxoacyl-ACP reductase FabG [Rhizomicrobium sp.]|jgi:3-oxoacyl-[acyl-carrier protein] reductase|nr:3-oxoacyl-ACP reductase FabG [Rhizomicrobium sp.]
MTEGRGRKPVLVTGASKGIGKAVALRLGREGFAVTVHYGRDRSGAESVAAEIAGAGGNAEIIGFDITDRDAVRVALETRKGEAFWGVVVNAGIARDNAFPAIDGESWDLVLRTNLDGFYNVLHPLVMPMIRRRDGGRIVTMSSVSGLVGNRGQVNYSASKAGIIGATKALALELAKRNITVNCIAPGIIETAMTENLPADEIKAAIPMRRPGKPEDVAALTAFLFGDDAGYITRQVISVNGGLC